VGNRAQKRNALSANRRQWGITEALMSGSEGATPTVDGARLDDGVEDLEFDVRAFHEEYEAAK
jgi:hypothetical protein